MKRIVVVSAVLAVAGAIAPWNGSAGAGIGPAPEHSLDMMIKLKGESDWVGTGVCCKPKDQQVVGVFHKAPGKAVAVIRIVNNGTETEDLDIWGSSIRYSFYGGAHWPTQETIEPGESVKFRYAAHRGDAEAGATMPVDFSVRNASGDHVLDGVRFLLKAVGRG